MKLLGCLALAFMRSTCGILAVATAVFCGNSLAQDSACPVAFSPEHTTCPIPALLPSACVEPVDDGVEIPRYTATIRILRGSAEEMEKLLVGLEDGELQGLREPANARKTAFAESLPLAMVEQILKNAGSCAIEMLLAPKLVCEEGQTGEVSIGTAFPERAQPQPAQPPLPDGQTEFPAHASLSVRLRPRLSSTGDADPGLSMETTVQLTSWRDSVRAGNKVVHPVQMAPGLLDFETRRVSTGFYPEPGCCNCLVLGGKSSFPFERVALEYFDDSAKPGAEPWKEKSLTLVLIRVEEHGED